MIGRTKEFMVIITRGHQNDIQTNYNNGDLQ